MISSRESLRGNVSGRASLKGSLNVGKEYVYPGLENLEVTPSSNEQVFNHTNSYGYDEVTVKAIQDDNLIPENIKNDVEIIGVKGIFVGSKYAPRIAISFRNYTGEELDHETQLLDTIHQTTFYNMFYNCTNLIELNINHWNTINITTLENCFYKCKKLTNLILNNWNTDNVSDMRCCFQDCSVLERLDLSGWTTENVTNMSSMFYFCSKLQYLDIRNFTFDSVTSYSNMFYYTNTSCEIIVKSDKERDWVLARNNKFTNIKTVAEL